MKPQLIGRVRVDSIPELDHWPVDPEWLLPGATKAEVAEHADWLGPRLVEPGTGRLVMRSHAYLIRTDHHTIVFDTCCGNHKERGGLFPFHGLDTPFLDRLAALGVAPEDVDFVMCSHLHADHVGWNTRLIDGRWVPTFPNARYLISRGEYEACLADLPGASTIARATYEDSILPIVEHGQAVLVADDHRLDGAMPDEIRFMPLNGHTAHHCGLHVVSQRQEAIFSGDAIHHPIQFVRRDWVLGVDREAAIAAIDLIVERCADTATSLLTAHFPAPTTGRLVSQAGSLRFLFDEA